MPQRCSGFKGNKEIQKSPTLPLAKRERGGCVNVKTIFSAPQRERSHFGESGGLGIRWMGRRGTPGFCGLRSLQLRIRYISNDTETTIDARVMKGVKKAFQRSRRRLAFISSSCSSLSSVVTVSHANAGCVFGPQAETRRCRAQTHDGPEADDAGRMAGTGGLWDRSGYPVTKGSSFRWPSRRAPCSPTVSGSPTWALVPVDFISTCGLMLKVNPG